jgi:hypothetical protein
MLHVLKKKKKRKRRAEKKESSPDFIGKEEKEFQRR